MAAYRIVGFVPSNYLFALLFLVWVTANAAQSINKADEDLAASNNNKATNTATTGGGGGGGGGGGDCLRLLFDPRGGGWRQKVLAKLRWRRRDHPTLGYRMMTLSALSYWEFHKRPHADNPTGFSLLSDVRGKRNHTTGATKFFHDTMQWLGSVVESATVLSVVHSAARTTIRPFPSDTRNLNETQSAYSSSQYRKKLKKPPKKRQPKKRITFQYEFFDWYEKGVAGVKFHDTDVLISTMEDDGTLIISFAGTSSAADAVTNIQTFEPANHSGFYHGGRLRTKHTGSRKGRRTKDSATTTANTQNTTTAVLPPPSPMIQGSLHRGFLNALTRVDRGNVLRLCHPETNPSCESTTDTRGSYLRYLHVLHEHFGNCTMLDDPPSGENAFKEKPKRKKRVWSTRNDQEVSHTNTTGKGDLADKTLSEAVAVSEEISIEASKNIDPVTANANANAAATASIIRPRRKGGCTAKGRSLLSILQELITSALQDGRVVHLTGHSLGGGLASHMALDLVVNFPQVPVDKLHLWTFGAPQIADSLFVESAIQLAPRLQPFIIGGRNNQNGRYHRFVTVADDCRPDAVSEVTKQSLPSHRRKGLHGKFARRLGGVHGSVVHVISEPHYLLTPQQAANATTTTTTITAPTRKHSEESYSAMDTNTQSSLTTEQGPRVIAAAAAATTTPPVTSTAAPTSTSHTKTHSTVAAHATVNYLHGLSRESCHHPLQTDLPQSLREWLGEPISV